ncbi:IS30 family transposase [Limosilactobacillus reuteri]|uniref:IS30 family transposase n=1 Tax=Limosilactobacillus reuteri TaxID=1598 RepID=UPI000A2D0DCC|nr:IS30 family transposase [Limosilactobacillus reuteri]OTA78002.1 IS30 family transposase [Limosilactobacillus reuteri]
MTYTHLTTNELTIIAHSFVQKLKAYRVAQMINRCAETVYRVYRYLETGASIADYQDHYMRNKQRCGRKRTQLSLAELTYINDKIAQGWTPDTIIGRAERPISCNRHPNGYVERRGKAGQLGRSIHERAKDFPHYATEFGHLEVDTVQGKKHQGAVMTLTERQSKVEIVLNVHEKTADAINQHLSQWLRKFPRHFFKSITFDNGKEFAGWREIANQFDLHTYFAEVGAPNQRGLNENNNGLLRRDGLTKQLDFRNLPDELVTQLMNKRNNLPRKSLGYRTPYEVFMSYVTDEQLFSF